jgi:hypothetical protein
MVSDLASVAVPTLVPSRVGGEAAMIGVVLEERAVPMPSGFEAVTRTLIWAPSSAGLTL